MGSLSTLNSACYDNTAGFYVEGNNSITFINADFTISNIVSFAFTNPLACEILSDSNMGYVLDYDFIDYPPLIVCENANGDISSPNQINLFDLNNSNRNFLSYFSATSIYPFYFGNSVNFNIMGIVTGSNGTNYTGGNINDITTSTAWNGIGYSPQSYPFSCAISSVNASLIIGSSYNG